MAPKTPANSVESIDALEKLRAVIAQEIVIASDLKLRLLEMQQEIDVAIGVVHRENVALKAKAAKDAEQAKADLARIVELTAERDALRKLLDKALEASAPAVLRP